MASRSCCRQNSSTVEFVDHSHDVQRVAAVYYTSVDCNPLTPLLRSVVDLLYILFLQSSSGWQDFDWHSASRGPSVSCHLCHHYYQHRHHCYCRCSASGERSIMMSGSVLLPVCEHISKTTSPVITNLCVCVFYIRCSVLPWWRCDMVCRYSYILMVLWMTS